MLSPPHCAAVKTSAVLFLNVVAHPIPIICHPLWGSLESWMNLPESQSNTEGLSVPCEPPFTHAFYDPFSSCLCLLLIIKQTFPHVNNDKPITPISFSWFLPLKLKLKFHQFQDPSICTSWASIVFLLTMACLECTMRHLSTSLVTPDNVSSVESCTFWLCIPALGIHQTLFLLKLNAPKTLSSFELLGIHSTGNCSSD